MAKRHLGMVLAWSIGCSLAPGDAFGQGVGAPSFDGVGLAIAAVAVGGGMVVGGLVTDGFVIRDLAAGQGVRRGPAIAGTVLWGVMTAVMLPISISMLTGSDVSADGVAALLAGDALVIGSLGLSIYGLSVPAPAAAPAPAPWLQRVSVLPGAIPAANGVAPGMMVSFRM